MFADISVISNVAHDKTGLVGYSLGVCREGMDGPRVGKGFSMGGKERVWLPCEKGDLNNIGISEQNWLLQRDKAYMVYY